MNAAGKIMKYKMREAATEKLNLQKAAAIVTVTKRKPFRLGFLFS